MRSTSGVFLKLSGPNTHFPFTACSVKQTAVSHSTTEAEIVAAELALRQEGMPALILWSKILGRDIECDFLEDNQACIRVFESGKNPTMRYLGRTHRVDLAWTVERFREGAFDLRYCTSEEQCADIFTKAFAFRDKWDEVRPLIGHLSVEELFDPNLTIPQYKPSGKPKEDPNDPYTAGGYYKYIYIYI